MGLGLTEGAGVGLGLGETRGLGIGETITAVLVSPKVVGIIEGLGTGFFDKKSIHTKTARLINIKAVITILKTRLLLIGLKFCEIYRS
ncbi:hypothetical protein HYW44_03720 [Candidatus Daviesbacteria bacterium]|nr:hypothetical protein [Candidatus Daviesbacteria bacterium]